ncbi:lipoprotein [Mycoplasma capricolum subsp. capricolum]|uniref:lipoprotein n=1 Tax=Mycoplasma capricolum TaxID=2095 RepID=UPI003DA36896
MKKLLTLLGSVTLITTTSAAVIACGGTRSEQKVTDTKKKDDKEKSKEEDEGTEDKKEEKLILSGNVKKEISSLVKTILTEVVDPKEENEEEVIKDKDAISNDFVTLLDEILYEKNKNVDESLKDFKEEMFSFASPYFVGDLLGKFPELKEENKELLDKLVWSSEINENSQKKDLVGIIFNKRDELEKNKSKAPDDVDGKDKKTLENILAEYKEYIAEYKKGFEEEVAEQFKQIKKLIEKDLNTPETK